MNNVKKAAALLLALALIFAFPVTASAAETTEARVPVSLAHTKWECKYHIVFAPKYRRQIIYGKNKQDIGQMLRKLCEYKGTELPPSAHA